MSSISLMTSPIIDLTSRPESPKEHQQIKATTTDITTKTTTTLPPPPTQQQSTVEAMMVKRIGKLKHIMANLIQVNKEIEERLDSYGSRLYTLEQLDIPQQVSIASHEDHMQLFEALEKSMNRDHSEELAQDLAKARKKKKKSYESPKTPPGSPSHQPPPPHPPAGPSGPSRAPGASGSSQAPPPPPPPPSTSQESPLRPSISLTPADLEIDEDMGPDEQAQLSDDEDIGSAYILTSSDVPIPTNNWASALASNYSPPLKDSLLAQTDDIATFMDWFYKRRGITELKPQDLQLVIRQRVKDFQLGIESYQTQLNLTKPQWDATGFEYKHDYIVIDSPRAVIFWDKYGVQMMMRFNEIHKFSDGTLQQIDEALDYRVKEFRINMMTPCLNTRFWTRKDVDRCKAFMFAIQRHLRTRRIFPNLESFVGRRVRAGDYKLLKRTE
uniref:Uncharacterized protein n=1 Tax=Tanacetum cinerariifolium TaxID=118510 RepID=A0A6L2NBX6_TANCI|nr:hypothetical protein [Tanacetum cinerariifolium]